MFVQLLQHVNQFYHLVFFQQRQRPFYLCKGGQAFCQPELSHFPVQLPKGGDNVHAGGYRRHLFIINQLQQKQIDGCKLGQPFAHGSLPLQPDSSQLRILVQPYARHRKICRQKLHMLVAEIKILIGNQPACFFIIFSFQQEGLTVQLPDDILQLFLFLLRQLFIYFQHPLFPLFS